MNSGIERVGVLTQYRPRSLNQHIGIGRPWGLDRVGSGVTLLQPYVGRDSSDWYRGTADAVYQNLHYIEESRAELVLVLAGDHVYKMNYDELIDHHRWKEADVTIPVYEVPMEQASRYGTMVMDDEDRIVAFDEKPEEPRSSLISMGIYLFKKEALEQVLMAGAHSRTRHDFGRHIVPAVLGHASLFGYRFRGYWRDIGTIEAYYEANMDLLEERPELDLYDSESEVVTSSSGLPPAKIGRRAYLSRSLISVGSTIKGHVEHSVLSPRVYVEEGAVIRDSIIFDGCLIQSGAIIDRSIVDKEVLVRKNCYVGYGDDLSPNQERPDIVNCGITIIGKRAKLPPSLRVGRNCVVGPGVSAIRIEDNYLASGRTLRLPPREARAATL
jgi:glucose-1-phosphate adenylyltransferase